MLSDRFCTIKGFLTVQVVIMSGGGSWNWNSYFQTWANCAVLSSLNDSNHCLKTAFELDDFQLILNFWWSDNNNEKRKTEGGSLLRGEIRFDSTAFKKNNKRLQLGEERLCCPGVAEKWKLAHWWHPAIKAIHYQGATVDLSRTAFMDENISSAFRSFP